VRMALGTVAIVITVSLFLCDAVAEGTAHCAGSVTLTTPSGTVTENADGVYNRDSDCRWLISNAEWPSGSSITITFSAFKLESSYDFLRIYDGADDSAPQLKKLHGYGIPDSVTATSGQMYLKFTSDGSQQKEGFTATYLVAGIPTPPPTTPPPTLTPTSPSPTPPTPAPTPSPYTMLTTGDDDDIPDSTGENCQTKGLFDISTEDDCKQAITAIYTAIDTSASRNALHYLRVSEVYQNSRPRGCYCGRLFAWTCYFNTHRGNGGGVDANTAPVILCRGALETGEPSVEPTATPSLIPTTPFPTVTPSSEFPTLVPTEDQHSPSSNSQQSIASHWLREKP